MTERPFCHAMTVDVEDYFHAFALSEAYPRTSWDRLPQRVGERTHRILDLFAEADVRGTFFTLGWVAERHKELIKRIVAEGHELASHGYAHERVDQLDPTGLLEDLRRSKAILEDLGGVEVHGYRAPCFSIGRAQWWAYDVLAEAGYAYSSSQHPIAHDHYGVPEAPTFPFYPDEGPVLEIPVATVEWAGRRLTCAGGGFFRLFPYPWTRLCWRRLEDAQGRAGTFYFHPWEIDADQPRAPGLALKSRLRHYVNLSRMEGKLQRLLSDFHWSTIARVYGHLDDVPRWRPA